MIIPATIGAQGQFLDENAYLTAVESAGLLGGLQIAVATILAEHTMFAGDRIPVVVEAVGDYIAEMNMLLNKGCMAALVVTPEFKFEGPGNAWVATVTVQVNETPAVNRSMAGQYVTSLRACEIVLAVLKDRQPNEMWGPWRPRGITAVQSDPNAVSYAVSGITKTIVRTAGVMTQ